eukprot:g17435.t1
MRFLSAKTRVWCAHLTTRRALSSFGEGHNRFDIPQRSSVVRGNSGKEASSRRAAWKLSGAFTRFDRSFEVFEVSRAGKLRRTSVTLADVLRDFDVHARDVLSLGLQDERYHPPPAVLPRDGVVVVALGPFKALVHTEACLLFEAGKVDVSHVAPILADLVQANNESPPSECRVDAKDGSKAKLSSPQPPPPRLGAEAAGAGADVDAAREGDDQDSSSATATATAATAAATTSRIQDPTSPPTATGAPGRPSSPPQREAAEPATRTTKAATAAATGAAAEGESPADTIAAKLGEYMEEALRFGAGVGGYADRGVEGEGGDEKEEDPQVHQMKVMFREQQPMPFELAMLEAMLHEVCTSYHRRAHVVRRLMEQGLQPSETTSFFAPSKIEHYRVVPLKLALKQLELKLSQTRMCLEELIQSDEDMLGLLLTETQELGQGEILDANRHSVVELLLENYHRQLVLVGHDVAAMKQEMESLQELSAISLDVSLNSMIAVDVRLAMLNLGVATSACVFGAMGMNTINGLESSPLAFYFLLGGSAAASALALGGVMKHLRSVVRAGDSQQAKLMALNTICDHVDDIESVLRTELESGQSIGGGGGGGDDKRGGVIRRDAMARKLARARGKEISEEELDLIFAVFDTSGDGSIDTTEYGKLITEPAGLLGANGGGAAAATESILPRR